MFGFVGRTGGAVPLRARVRRILALALPIIGGMLSQNLLNLVDTAMVGRLGAPALAAVGLGGMVNWLSSAFFLGMGAGVQAIAARRSGEGRPGEAVEALHAALVVGLFVFVPLSLLLATQTRFLFGLLTSDPEVAALGAPYLACRMAASGFVVANFAFRGFWNGTGRSTVYLSTILVIHAVNILLNWVLIYGHLGAPRLGVLGAGISSAVAVATGTGIYVLLARRHAGADGFLSRGRFSRAAVGAVLRLSVPAGLQGAFLAAGFVLFYRLAELLGTRQLAATNVLINLSMVCILPAMGFGLAAATLVGQALGAGDRKGAASWGWTTVGLASGAMLLLGLVLAIAPDTWLGLLANDRQTQALARVPLVLLAMLQPLDAVGVVLSQSLLGAGAVRRVMVVSIVLQWGVFLPVAYLWGVKGGGGLLALWISLGVWRSAFSAVMLLLFWRGGWTAAKV